MAEDNNYNLEETDPLLKILRCLEDIKHGLAIAHDQQEQPVTFDSYTGSGDSGVQPFSVVPKGVMVILYDNSAFLTLTYLDGSPSRDIELPGPSVVTAVSPVFVFPIRCLGFRLRNVSGAARWTVVAWT